MMRYLQQISALEPKSCPLSLGKNMPQTIISHLTIDKKTNIFASSNDLTVFLFINKLLIWQYSYLSTNYHLCRWQQFDSVLICRQTIIFARGISAASNHHVLWPSCLVPCHRCHWNAETEMQIQPIWKKQCSAKIPNTVPLYQGVTSNVISFTSGHKNQETLFVYLGDEFTRGVMGSVTLARSSIWSNV